ncbi:MAG: HAMP domain-containing histidine kinase [Lachnospiraceae bacterium]|nr:HAMP domain-containing histidine kinase [Lachnospiraceae bacterium]
MLKEMRIRVIVAAMLAFSAVIIIIAASVNIVNYVVSIRGADETLAAIMRFEEGAERDMPVPVPPGPPDRIEDNANAAQFMMFQDVERNYMTRFFAVHFDADGEVDRISREFIATIDSADALDYAGEVLNGGKTRGFKGAFRYAVLRSEEGTIVAFLNVSREQESMRSLLKLSLAIIGISLPVVFVLVSIFSGRAIRPIANNIRQQKQFITDASHELKTPLTSISTSMDVITMERGEDEWTANIRAQIKRMSKLVGELVTLSRLDEDIPLPDKEEFSLSNIAWEVAQGYEIQAKSLDKEFVTDIAEDMTMTGVKTSVSQMLSVLLDNAIRYSDDKGKISLRVFKKGGRSVIEVFNTCDYKEPPDTSRLFDRFYRPDSSRSTETGGYGVGLAIAKAVAEAHGGTISASCPDGKTMTITARI